MDKTIKIDKKTYDKIIKIKKETKVPIKHFVEQLVIGYLQEKKYDK